MNSLMPPGGWDEAPRPSPEPAPVRPQPVAYAYQPNSRVAYAGQPMYIPCRVCNRGSMVAQKKFRMSAPVVAIGFILLIPSVLGMVISGLSFFGIMAPGGDSSETVIPVPQTPFEASFRRTCAENADRSYSAQHGGVALSSLLKAKYCECALTVIELTGSQDSATQSCLIRAKNDTLRTPPRPIQALYTTPGSDPVSTSIVKVLGGGFSIFAFVISFVGGLLGWLLVMRKRVLQCGVCSAVVQAS